MGAAQGNGAITFQPRYYTRDNKPGGQPSETADITNCHKAGDSAPHVMAFQPRYARNGRGAPDTIAAPLTAEAGRTGKGDSAQCVAFPGMAQSGAGWAPPSMPVDANRTGPLDTTRAQCAAGPWGVRRLTPTECRRLQGFTDDWNDWQSDSAAYRQLGNAVCVNEAEWLGRQLLAAMEAQ